jgi:hypothetical protein
MSYDQSAYQIRREVATGDITGAASGSLKKFLFFQAAKLKKVHGIVTVAGTHTAAVMDVYVGTSSVGTIAFGTNTAGTVVHSGAIDATIPANGYVDIKGATNSATLAASLAIEFNVTPDAAVS